MNGWSHPLRAAALLALAALILTAAPGCASGPAAGTEVEPGVVMLGQRSVNFGADRDVVHVGAHEGGFKALRIRVGRSPLEMYDIRVHFGNGKVWSPATRLRFARGSWTRRIDLPGHVRQIEKVVFFYRSKRPRTGKAKVELYGIR